MMPSDVHRSECVLPCCVCVCVCADPEIDFDLLTILLLLLVSKDGQCVGRHLTGHIIIHQESFDEFALSDGRIT